MDRTHMRLVAAFGGSVLIGAGVAFIILPAIQAALGGFSVQPRIFALILPTLLFAAYLSLARARIHSTLTANLDVEGFSDPDRYRTVAQRNWDIALVVVVLSVLFLYRLETWNIIRLEEWVVYSFFDEGDWLLYRSLDRLNSIFLPTFALASLFPFETVIEYRYFTAGLSMLGGVIYYVAIREAAKSRFVAFIAVALLAMHTWIVLFGRMFFQSWSGILLSSLALLTLIRFKEAGARANGVITGVSVINFAHAVFFAFPFLAAERIHGRNRMSTGQIVVPLLIFSILLTPAVFLFLEEQPRRLSQEYEQRGGEASDTLTLPGTDSEIYWPIDAGEAFRAFRDSLSITQGSHPFAYGDFSLTDRYSILAALLLIYPLIALKLFRWEYAAFFSLGAILSFLLMVVFPITVNPSYTKELLIFTAPLLAYGAVKSRHRPIQILSILLVVSILGVYAADTFNDIILYDAEDDFDTRIGDRVRNETFVVGEEAYQLITDSRLDLLDGYSYTVMRCDQIAGTDAPAVTSFPSCAGPDKDVVARTRVLYLSR